MHVELDEVDESFSLVGSKWEWSPIVRLAYVRPLANLRRQSAHSLNSPEHPGKKANEERTSRKFRELLTKRETYSLDYATNDQSRQSETRMQFSPVRYRETTPLTDAATSGVCSMFDIFLLLSWLSLLSLSSVPVVGCTCDELGGEKSTQPAFARTLLVVEKDI